MQTVDETIREVARRFAWPARRSGDLLCGRGSDPVQRVVVCVNSAEVERVEDEHALILVASEVATLVRGRAYSRVVAGRSVSHVLQQAAERHQSLLVAPEMLHFGAGGFDARLVEALGLQDVRVAAPRRAAGFRLVGFVPPAHLDAVRDACFAAGAGQIGEYDSCSWSNPGTGTFRGSDRSQPRARARSRLSPISQAPSPSPCRVGCTATGPRSRTALSAMRTGQCRIAATTAPWSRSSRQSAATGATPSRSR